MSEQYIDSIMHGATIRVTEVVVLLDALRDANALEARLDCVEVAPQLK